MFWNLYYRKAVLIHYQGHETMEKGGSVVERSTRDQGAAGSSLNRGTVLCPCPDMT